MVKLRRENWKGKFMVTARLDNGRMIARKKWSGKFKLENAKIQFKKTNSFNPKVFKDLSLVNTIEVIDTRIEIDKDKKFVKTNAVKSQSYGKFQYAISVRVQGKIISSRSSQFNNSASVNTARNEALENLYSGLSAKILGQTDKNEGKILFDDSKITKEGIIYYNKK